jgi:hypothetical protein
MSDGVAQVRPEEALSRGDMALCWAKEAGTDIVMIA